MSIQNVQFLWFNQCRILQTRFIFILYKSMAYNNIYDIVVIIEVVLLVIVVVTIMSSCMVVVTVVRITIRRTLHKDCHWNITYTLSRSEIKFNNNFEILLYELWKIEIKSPSYHYFCLSRSGYVQTR